MLYHASRLACAAVALALLVPGASAQGVDGSAPGNRDFDYFLFVRQYPPTHCNSAHCYHEANFEPKFTIHGLWPQYNNGHWPQFCQHNAHFDEDAVADLMPEMEEEWPSWFPQNDGFWEHEWTKHGTCAAVVMGMSEHDYFGAAINMHHKYNVEDALAAAGIVPSPYKKYLATDMEKALMDAYGARPLIHCNYHGVTEIWMCATKEFELFDCENSNENWKCGQVAYPLPRDRNSEPVVDGDAHVIQA